MKIFKRILKVFLWSCLIFLWIFLTAFANSEYAEITLNEVNIDLTYDDFERIRKKTPHLADMKPGGNYVMESLDRIGGIPFVLKKLLDKGSLNKNQLIVGGKPSKFKFREKK